MTGTIAGAASQTSTARGMRAMTIRLAIVATSRRARSFLAVGQQRRGYGHQGRPHGSGGDELKERVRDPKAA